MTNIFKIIILAFSLGAILNSCVTTKTTSYSDPDFKGVKFTKLCIYADVQDLESRKKMESSVTEKLREAGILAYSGTDMFPPTRDWSDDAIRSELQKQNIDGYLLLQWLDSQVSERVNPGETRSETVQEKEKRGGKVVTVEKTKTYQTDPSVERTFYSQFKAELIDVKSSKTAWVATSNSESGEFLGDAFDLIFDSYAKDIVEKLAKDGHIELK
jgi:hypothetical protein